MAAAFGAEWLAVAVETQGAGPRHEATRQQIAQHLRMAEQLGAETHILIGDNVAQTIADYARSRNVTKIVVGKTAQSFGVNRSRRRPRQLRRGARPSIGPIISARRPSWPCVRYSVG
jgi:two-component system sensor histidine kinase KdpD